MSRPTTVSIRQSALVHNINQVKKYTHGKKIIAMVKANAYGCGLDIVAPTLEAHVDAFGVACLEEALAIKAIGINKSCILFQGIFTPDELKVVNQHQFQLVLHNPEQLTWLISTPMSNPVKVWVKVNTGMNRLGYSPHDAHTVIQALTDCQWVNKDIGLMTHLGYADVPEHPKNNTQLECFNGMEGLAGHLTKSISNSAAIIALPDMHADVVRPGIMLYGVSPFEDKTGVDLGLQPVMQLASSITAIHHYPPHNPIGYGGIWQSKKKSIIGVVPVGYGDGYPRSAQNPNVWINGHFAPVVGRVSMDMLTVDLTHCPDVKLGDCVELWGRHVPVEQVAKSSGTIPYELLCAVTARVRNSNQN